MGINENLALNIKWPHVYKMFFLCAIEEEKQIDIDEKEVINLGFLSYNDLPSLSTERTSIDQIKICFKHFYNAALSTEFE